jgi:branched-chain amino acid transport system permease protein
MQAIFGPLIGAVTFLILEEGLSRITDYSNLILGPFLLFVAISMHGGIDGLISGVRRG